MEFDNPKLFIGGIAQGTDEATLEQHFSEYGEVKEALVIPEKRIGFVTFSNPSMAKNALQKEHIVLGKKVDVKPARPEIEKTEIVNINNKIFVGGLPYTITLEKFKEYFGSYGAITDAFLAPDKERHKFRGFGFVTYDSEDAAANVLQNRFHLVDNKMVEVKIATPREDMKSNYGCHECRSLAVQRNAIHHAYARPVSNLPRAGGWYCVWIPYGYEPGFVRYDQVYGHANSNYSTVALNWPINW
ncbi:hypothetical protein DITRI_Ditri16bG0048400 [Diplodiscus trichospermus]